MVKAPSFILYRLHFIVVFALKRRYRSSSGKHHRACVHGWIPLFHASTYQSCVMDWTCKYCSCRPASACLRQALVQLFRLGVKRNKWYLRWTVLCERDQRTPPGHACVQWILLPNIFFCKPSPITALYADVMTHTPPVCWALLNDHL